MQYLLIMVIIGALAYTVWRVMRAQANRPRTRTIGPDDDPEFLWRLNHPDNKPR